MNGATLEEWLRAFAGPVGAKPGALKVPLSLSPKDGRIITGTGVYGGPNLLALDP